MRTDKKIKYFSTSIVRKSVIKKLTALLSTTEDEINHYFDFHDLLPNTWNSINGLEVKPTNSPHPVENVIFQFRSLWHDGYRTYAHLADICSFDYLDEFIQQNNKIAEQAKTIFCEPATLKKIDIGGGMIHGRAIDFKNDQSKKIVLAHTSLEMDSTQKEIGSSASFGTVDILIPNTQSQELRAAYY
jgi:hemerythrin